MQPVTPEVTVTPPRLPASPPLQGTVFRDIFLHQPLEIIARKKHPTSTLTHSMRKRWRLVSTHTKQRKINPHKYKKKLEKMEKEKLEKGKKWKKKNEKGKREKDEEKDEKR